MCSHMLFLQIGVLSPGRSNNNWKMKTAFASPSQTATVTKVRLFGLWTGERIMGKWTQRAVRELGQKIMDGPVSSRTQGSESPQLGNTQVRHELIGESMNTNMWLFSGRDFSVGLSCPTVWVHSGNQLFSSSSWGRLFVWASPFWGRWWLKLSFLQQQELILSKGELLSDKGKSGRQKWDTYELTFHRRKMVGAVSPTRPSNPETV